MANRVSLSSQEKTIEYIKGWYEDQTEAIDDLRLKIISAFSNSNNIETINSKFHQLDLAEINRYFDNSRKELEHLVCLDLISATEAFLRVDYIKRIRRRDRSNLTRTFRDIDSDNGNNVSLEVIIESWKNVRSKKSFSDFLGLLKYRHWLAHGRYWTPKMGRDFSFDITYKITEAVFNTVSK